MTDIAKHIRIFNPEPDDDFVNKRSEAVNAIVEAFTKNNAIDVLIKLGNDLTVGLQFPERLDKSVTEIVEREIKKQSASFVAEGEQLQIVTLALVAALQYLENNQQGVKTSLTVPDVLGISLWSSLSFQQPMTEKAKFENLRCELLEASKKVVYSNAFSTRSRIEVPEFKKITVVDTTTPNDLASSVQKAFSSVVEPMRTNAVLDREEIDLLWWVLNDWSDIVGKKFSQLNQVQNAILSGLEVSNTLRRLPTEAHYKLAAHSVRNGNLYDAGEILEQMGDLILPISEHLKKHTDIIVNSAIFPLSTILIAGTSDSDNAKTKRLLTEWCGRALLEGTMINMSKFLSDGF